MTVDEFVQLNKLMPCDAVIMRKSLFPLVNHYVLYLGMKDGQHQWVANYYPAGVKEIPRADLKGFLERFVPDTFERFEGSEHERQQALERARKLIGDKKYHFVSNNCEHYKNYVQRGEFRSEQAITSGNVALLGGFGLMAAGVWLRKSGPLFWGFMFVLAGGMVHSMEKRNRALYL